MGTSIVYGAWAARDARKKAEAAANKSALGDETRVVLRSGIEPKRIVYGAGWVPSVIAGHRPARNESDPYFWLVLALPIAHEIVTFLEVWVDDYQILPLAANGAVQIPEFNKIFRNTHTEEGTLPADKIIHVIGAPGDTVQDFFVLGPMQGEPNPTVSIREINLQVHLNTGENMALSPWLFEGLVNVTVLPHNTNPRQILVTGDAVAPGQHYVITYTYQYTKNYLSCWLFNGTQTTAFQPLIDATSQSDLFEEKWTQNDVLFGIPYAVFRLYVDFDVFPNAIGDIRFLVWGKPLFDPRDGLVKSDVATIENTALQINDYLVRECGAEPGDINQSLLIGQINECAELVTMPGGAQRRYSTYIVLSTEAKPIDNLGKLVASCDGSIVTSGPTIDVRVGAYEPPQVSFSFSDGDFMTSPVITKGLARPDLFNGMKARFSNAEKRQWPMEEAPAFRSVFYSGQDGKEIIREVDLSGIIEPYRAQRICKQMTVRARNGFALSATFTVKGYRLSPEMTVALNCTPAGISNKVFRVKSMNPVGLDQVEISMVEDGPLLYEWNFDEASGVDPTPNTILPNIRNVPMVVFTIDTSLDAAAFGVSANELTSQARITWNQITDPLVLTGGYVEIRHKRTYDMAWTYSPKMNPYNNEYHFPVRYMDRIQVQARAANSRVVGQWNEPPRDHLASDTPTQPLSAGNLLEWPLFWAPGAEPPWEYPWDFKGWNFPVSIVDGSYWTTAPDFELSTGVVDDPRNMGYLVQKMIVEGLDQVINFASTIVPAPVVGTRVCAYVYHWDDGKTFNRRPGAGVHLFFLDKNGNLTGQVSTYSYDTGSIPVKAGSAQLSDFVCTGCFGTVPEGSVSMELYLNYSHKTPDSAFVIGSTIKWFHPYLGIASPNQTTFPPWTK